MNPQQRLATLYGPNGQRQVVTSGTPQASHLQSQGWGLTAGSYRPAQPATPMMSPSQVPPQYAAMQQMMQQQLQQAAPKPGATQTGLQFTQGQPTDPRQLQMMNYMQNQNQLALRGGPQGAPQQQMVNQALLKAQQLQAQKQAMRPY